jgi:Mg-chelatase subunit ChlD
MIAIRKKIFFLGGFILLALIALPIALYYSQKPQQTKSNAEKTVDLSYQSSITASNSAIQIPAGSTFNLDVYVDPGTNSISLVKLDMTYDPSKFQLAGGFIPNQSAFPQVVETPQNASGSITATLSIGSDLSAAIKTKTKVGTLELKALDTDSPSTATIGFASDSQALSVSSNSSYDENVIANTIPATVLINRPSANCGTSPGDTMLVMDNSGSMNDQAGTSGTKISNAIASADNFISIVAGQASNRVGLVNFSSSATLDSPLTSSFSAVTTQVNALKPNGETCIQCGIDKANTEITTDKRAGVKNAVILLTDGLANYVEGSNKQVSTATAEQAALTAATNAYKANGTVFYTIGLGQNVDSAFLTKLAQSTGGQYYFSPTTDQLNTIYSQISQVLSGGSISGTVFNDLAANGVYDPSDPGIPGIVMQLNPAGSSAPAQIISTSSDGTYSMQNVCNGNYTLSQTLPATWIQTLPTGGNGYSVTMTNGNAITNENFGDKVNLPTPTPDPTPAPLSPTAASGTTQLALNVLMDGIGIAGDNANPTASSLSEKMPVHPTRNATALIFDVNNNLVATASGQIQYSSASGSFVGTVSTSTPIPDGNYTIKVRSDYHLTRLVPGIEHLVPNQVNQVPTVQLVAGDANNDNQLNIIDYNLMIGCYSDLSPAVSCDPDVKPTTDFNDDGDVNQFDYNLFLRELSTQPGE